MVEQVAQFMAMVTGWIVPPGTELALADSLAGFKELVERVREGWIGPAFMLIVAGIGVVLAIKRDVRMLIGAIVVFIVAGVLIYAPQVVSNTSQIVADNTDSLGF